MGRQELLLGPAMHRLTIQSTAYGLTDLSVNALIFETRITVMSISERFSELKAESILTVFNRVPGTSIEIWQAEDYPYTGTKGKKQKFFLKIYKKGQIYFNL